MKRGKASVVESKYEGKVERVVSDGPFFEFAVALPGVNFKSPKMELYNILRVLMGNASSFSSGGPGKGMHSRCTKNLLNKEPCIESATYLLAHFQNHGLFGLYSTGPHENAKDVVEVTLREFGKLRNPISSEEL